MDSKEMSVAQSCCSREGPLGSTSAAGSERYSAVSLIWGAVAIMGLATAAILPLSLSLRKYNSQDQVA